VILPWGEPTGHLRRSVIPGLAEHYGFEANRPWGELPEAVRHVILHGSGGERIRFPYREGGRGGYYSEPWEGVLANVKRRHEETGSDAVREQLEAYMTRLPCPECGGGRLRPESRAVTVAGVSIGQAVELSVAAALRFFRDLPLSGHGAEALPVEVAAPVLKEVTERLQFLANVGLDYLTLGRSAETLSGGEAQRIRLATQIGSRLVGVLYILDEPSIGLHQRDNDRLIATLITLRDLGNTVIVVEHDEDTIRSADHLIDIGPGAGLHGGKIVASGAPEDVAKNHDSITGRYLSGLEEIAVPIARRGGNGKELTIKGAHEHNLKNIDAAIPLGKLTVVSGVSGSGKSTLVNDILAKELAHRLHRAHEVAGRHESIEGIDHLDKVIVIDQSPIGRTPRSNPATYTGVFNPNAELFSSTPQAK
jgi:excinuclease ABC subunit A